MEHDRRKSNGVPPPEHRRFSDSCDLMIKTREKMLQTKADLEVTTSSFNAAADNFLQRFAGVSTICGTNPKKAG